MDISPFDVVALNALQDNYIWAIVSHNTPHIAVVDPGEATPVLHFLQDSGRILSAIFITHHHWDHCNGVNDLLQAYPGTPVYGPALEPVAGMTEGLHQQAQVHVPELSLTFRVEHIPGHTLGHVALIGHQLAFTGDTLFTAGCGKIFEGTATQMYHSLQTLAALPPATKIYCGHEYTQQNLHFALMVEPDNSDIIARLQRVVALRAQGQPTVPDTVAEELRTNPFLRTHVDRVIKAAADFAGEPLEDPIAVLQHLRDWKNTL